MGSKLKALLLGLLLCCGPAFAAGVDGDWSGSLDTPNGPVQIGYAFKADGTTLTGTTTGPDGAKVTFAVDFDRGGTPTTFKYRGVVAADSIALSSNFQGQSVNFTVRKAAK